MSDQHRRSEEPPDTVTGSRIKNSGWRATRTWMRQAGSFARRHFRQYLRSRVSLVFLVAWPAFWYLLVAHLLLATGSMSTEVAATAKAAFAVSFGLFGTFTVSLTGVVGTFSADVSTKRYRKFRSLPISPSADLAGRFLAGVGLSLVSYTGLLLIGLADGAAFTLRRPWSPAVVGIGVVAFVAIGVVIAIALAAIVPRPEYATTLAMAVLLTTFFGTGFNGVSPSLFPGPPALLNVVPVSLITRNQLFHLVASAGTAPRAFSPPGLPHGAGTVSVIISVGVAALGLGVLLLGRAVYVGEAGE